MNQLDELRDRAWAALAPHLPGKAGDVGRTGDDNRLLLSAGSWLARHGCAWRALPAHFGKHGPVRQRRRRGARLDSALVRAHAQAAASRKKKRVGDEAPGRRRGGLSTRIHALVDALGTPWPLVLGAGQQADCRRAAELLVAAAGAGAGNVRADKACATGAVAAAGEAMGAQGVTASKKNRKTERLIARKLHRARNKIERFFSRLKQFRRLATRYDKTASSFWGMLHFVSALLWLR